MVLPGHELRSYLSLSLNFPTHADQSMMLNRTVCALTGMCRKQEAEAPITGVSERRQYLAMAVRAAHGGDGEQAGAGGRPPDLVGAHAGRPGAEGAQGAALRGIPQDDLAVLPGGQEVAGLVLAPGHAHHALQQHPSRQHSPAIVPASAPTQKGASALPWSTTAA